MDWGALALLSFMLLLLWLVVYSTSQETSNEKPNQEHSSDSRFVFEQEIRPMFRESDIETMKGLGLDLSDYNDVRKNAGKIYNRVSDGSMPCDGGWDATQVKKFKKWMDSI